MNSSAPLPVASDPPTQLTIALVVRRYDHTGGGAERWTHSHAAWLLQAGCRVLVVCERATGVPRLSQARDACRLDAPAESLAPIRSKEPRHRTTDGH